MKEERLERLQEFFASRWYIFTVSILVILGHSTLYEEGQMLLGGYQELIFGGGILLLACVGCYVCTDLRFLMMPFMSLIFLVTLEHSPNVPNYSRFYLEPLPLMLILFFAVLLFFSIGWFVLKNRHFAKPIAWRGKAFFSMAIFCGGLFLNGIFTRYYTIADTLYPISFLLSMLCVYALFAAFVRFDKETMEYFMTCLLSVGLIICAELLLGYLAGGIRFDENGDVVKESVMLGWGIWTAIGGMLVFLLPVSFYFAHSHRRGWIYFLIGMLEYLCILLSQSRGALLFGTGILIICLGILVTHGKNRRTNRIFVGCIVGVGILFGILFWDRLSSVLHNYLRYGLDDNGRFEKWRVGWNYFLENPIFGSGFYTPFDYGGWQKDVYPYLYHNTPIQILSSCGIVGMAAYLYHRYCTIWVALKQTNICKIFLGLSVLGLVSFSLLDVLFFNTYPTILYSLMLLFMEKSDEIFQTK